MIPALTAEEYDSLKDSIKNNGLWIPILVNQDNVILDGHHRYKICKELGIKIKHAVRTFPTKLDEEIFVIECNVKRRQLDDLGKHKIYEKLKPLYKQRAKLKQIEAGKKYGENHPKSLRTNDHKLSSKEKEESLASTQAANEVNLSRKKAQRMDHVKEQDPKLYEQIGQTDKITVNKAYTIIRKKEKRKLREKEIKKLQVHLPKSIQLYNQQFQTLKVKPKSISLIFTDPPYHDKFLYLFEDLAKQAGIVLRDGGSLVTFVGQGNIGKIIIIMEKVGLKFHWPLVIKHTGPSASVFGKKVLVGCKIMLWFVKGKYEGEFVSDIKESKFQGKELHEWAQSTVESDYYIKYMTIPNEIIYDPFMGSGTTGISAKKLNRQFIGCEDNSKDENDYFTIAQKRISNA